MFMRSFNNQTKYKKIILTQIKKEVFNQLQREFNSLVRP
jgi:hypothetical protein